MLRPLGLALCLAACGVDTGPEETGETLPDPADLSALSAGVHSEIGSIIHVTWEQQGSATASARYSSDEDEWHSTPTQDFGSGSQELLLLGIPYDTTLSWQLTWEDDCGSHESVVRSIRTDPLPEGAPEVSSISGSEEDWDASMPYVLTAMDGTGLKEPIFAFIIDRQGRIVWLVELPTLRISLHPRISQDGTELLIDHGTFWSIFDGGALSQVLRTRIDGEVVHTYDTPGLHHPFTELPDGSLVWGAYKGLRETLQKVGTDGVEEMIFDCGDYFDDIGEQGPCASNTVYWDATRDVFLYSLYSVDSILEVDHASGEVTRSFGHLAGAWSFAPEDGAFWWQHGAHFLEDGNLLLSCQAPGSETLIAREYELDDADGVLRQVWSNGQAEEIQGSTMGEVHRLPSGNSLHNYGSTPRLREFTADGEVVWDVQWQAEYIGRSTPISDLYSFKY